MNQGKYVFAQVMEYFPRWVFEKSVRRYGGDFHAKNLNSYSHCLHLMFGQMAGCKSLKDISLVLKSLKNSVYHLGIPAAVDSSSLSKANEVRDYRIFEELGMWLINKVRPMYAKESIPNVYLFQAGRSLRLTQRPSRAASSWPNGPCVRAIQMGHIRDGQSLCGLGPLVIANIYRNRWQIETFFKWIKGNLTVKSLWG